MVEAATVSKDRFEHMRANRDLWVHRHAQLEQVIQTIKAQIEHFEQGVEAVAGDPWTFQCSADDMHGLGLARVLCEIVFEPGFPYRDTAKQSEGVASQSQERDNGA